MSRFPVARTLHDVGLAIWFGGTLAGAVGINGAANDVDDPRQRARVANSGWARWTPVNAAAIGSYLTGSALLLVEDRKRTVAQQGATSGAVLKTALTGVALAATAYSRVLGQKLMKAGDFPAEGGAKPSAATPPELAKAQQQLRALQWALPAITGGLVVNQAVMSEQMRPTEVAKGVAQRLAGSVGDGLTAVAQHPKATAAAGVKALQHAL